MGPGFVIFLHLTAIFILSLTIAIVATIITAFISSGEKENIKSFSLVFLLSSGFTLFTLSGSFAQLPWQSLKGLIPA
jgi:hypothetical protein